MPSGTFTNPALAKDLLDALDAVSGGCTPAFGPPMPRG